MNRKLQKKTPYVSALKSYIAENNTVFDVPGHHQGEIKTDIDKIYSHKIFRGDVNCPRGLDNIMNPTGVIKEAQELMADALGAKYSRFLVNGSTVGNLIMVMTAIKANEKIILPRNVHKSVINALILSGGVPVFVMPQIDRNTEIVNQPTLAERKKAIDLNPDAKAIFVINPTYFGATTDLKHLVAYAHKKGLLVLADEAHGSHFYFNKQLPISAMKAGADMSTLSFHKTGGSLTQSSVLLIGTDRISPYDVSKTYNMLTTTSPSSILLSSLDAARKFLVFHGKEKLDRAIKISEYAAKEISGINGFNVRAKEHFLLNGAFDYDLCKVVIEIDKVNLSGFEIYKLLKDKYHVQIELAETYVLLLIISIGTVQKDIDKLIDALKEISTNYYDETMVYANRRYLKSFPELAVRPRSAFHAPLKRVKIEDAENEISKEMIMVYPPGIPLIVPGEMFTKEVINQIIYYRSIDTTILSDYPDGTVSVVDKDNWDLERQEQVFRDKVVK
ncbi:MAG: aminotransferase class I/II-fold pyridoxal phosphate-dependent enzyme [Bacilli bacterium]